MASFESNFNCVDPEFFQDLKEKYLLYAWCDNWIESLCWSSVAWGFFQARLYAGS